MQVAGDKSHLVWTRHYMACVVLRGSQRSLQILDLQNKLLAFTLPLTQVCTSSAVCLLLVVPEHGRCCTLSRPSSCGRQQRWQKSGIKPEPPPVSQASRVSSDVQEVRHVLPMSDGLVAVVQADGSGLTLRERSLQIKLDLLFSKHLYTVALNLARTEQVRCTPAVPVCQYHGIR